jgi:hypothetical protein
LIVFRLALAEMMRRDKPWMGKWNAWIEWLKAYRGLMTNEYNEIATVCW